MGWRAIDASRDGTLMTAFYRMTDGRLTVRLNGMVRSLYLIGSEQAAERIARLLMHQLIREAERSAEDPGTLQGDVHRG